MHTYPSLDVNREQGFEQFQEEPLTRLPSLHDSLIPENTPKDRIVT